MDADVARSSAGEDREPALERRDWERIAYGPDATEDERREAQAVLDRLRGPVTLAATSSSGARPLRAPAEPEATAEAAEPAETAEPEAGPRPRFRFRGVIVALAVVAGLLAAVAVLPQVLAPSSLSVFEREQNDADQDVPTWLANALATAAGASGEQGAGARVHQTLRRIAGDGRSAFVFTDSVADTICMAVAADALACVPTDVFDRKGIKIAIIDPRDPTASGGVRYSWGPRGGLKAERFEFDVPVRAVPMPVGTWRTLVTQCMAERGYAALPTAQGGVIPENGDDLRTLGFTINRVGCMARYPLHGVYYGPISPTEA